MEEAPSVNQDTIKYLSWDDFMRNGLDLLYQCDDTSTATTITYDTSSDHENIGKTITNMKKDQVTTLVRKEDNTESTATKTTATFTSSCESEWDEYTSDLMMKPTLSDHIYVFGRRRWVKPAHKRRTPAP